MIKTIGILFSILLFYVYGQTTVTILHTNNINGTLENCLCSDHPLGSIEKIKPIVDSLRVQTDNVLFVDSGDFFSAFGDQEKDKYALDALKLMGYDLLVPGDQEFSNGVSFFRDHIFKQSLPYISATIKVEGIPDLPDHKILKYGGIKILVISITNPATFKFYDQSRIKGIQIIDPVTRLNDILNDKEIDFTILLSHSGLEEDITIVDKFPQIGLIIGGHSQHLLKEARKVNETYIVQSGSDGYHLGKLVLRFGENKELESFYTKLIPLSLDLPNDPQIAQLATNWNFQFISNYLKKRTQWVPLDEGYIVAGAESCAECHYEQFKSWQKGPHTQSWQTIIQEKKTKSLKCESCHVSGFGRINGFINENLTPNLMHINCTDCHWTTEKHLINKDSESVAKIDDTVCLRCHDTANDPGFNFVMYKQRILH